MRKVIDVLDKPVLDELKFPYHYLDEAIELIKNDGKEEFTTEIYFEKIKGKIYNARLLSTNAVRDYNEQRNIRGMLEELYQNTPSRMYKDKIKFIRDLEDARNILHMVITGEEYN